MSYDRSLIDEYICEAREHLSSVEADFLAIEKKNGGQDLEVINRIFRAVHTIKGGAGFLGCTVIGKLSHAMETVLSLAREGTLVLKPSILDALISGIDMLNSLFDNIDGSNDVDVSALIARLGSELNGGIPDSVLKALQVPVEISTPSSDVTFHVTAQDLKLVPTEHCNFYVLSYNLTRFEKQKGLSPVALIRDLLKLGTIVDGFLTSDSGDLRQGLPSADLAYKVLYATLVFDDIISTAVDLDDEHICRIDPHSFLTQIPAVTQTVAENFVQPVSSASAPPELAALPKGEVREESSTQANDTIRIRLDILDRLMMLAGELVLVRNQELMNVDRSNAVSRTIAQRLDIVTTDLQETIMRTRMQPIGTAFSRFTRIVRDLGLKLNKKIELEMSGNEVEVDKTILEALVDPLVHIVRNSCDHGIELPEVRKAAGKAETGRVVLKAYHEGGQIVVEVSDDGKGIDADKVRAKALEKGLKTVEELGRMSQKELQSLIFLPAFSTMDAVSDLSGRGVGMDVVKTSVERLGGVIDLSSEKGGGTKMVLRLPLTLAIIPSLIVKSGGARYAIPQINLEGLVCLYDSDIQERIECAGSNEVYRLRNMLLPMVHLSEVFSHMDCISLDDRAAITERTRTLREQQHSAYVEAKKRGESAGLSLNFAILKAGQTHFGLCIDSVIGTEEIVVKPMHRAVKNLDIYSGATVLGDGCVALILDALGIARFAGVEFNEHETASDSVLTLEQNIDKRGLLLFKSGAEEIFAIEMSHVKRVEKIATEKIEHVGGKEFITIDGVSTRVLTLESQIPVSACTRSNEMFLLLPKNTSKPCGVLLSKLLDIGQFNVKINEDSFKGEGVLGTAIIKERMTLFLDLETILQREAV